MNQQLIDFSSCIDIRKSEKDNCEEKQENKILQITVNPNFSRADYDMQQKMIIKFLVDVEILT